MAEFSGKILSAVYANPEYTMVKVRYDDGNGVCIYNLTPDPDNPDFQALEAEGWTQERLIEETAEAKMAESRAFNIQVNEAAKKLIEEQFKETDAKLEESEDYFNFILNDVDKDNLFKAKLWALETEVIKSASKEQKAKIRKSKSLLELFAVLFEVKSK